MTRDADRLNPAAILWPGAALAGYAVFLCAPETLGDSDTFWHVAAGDWIIAHRAVPTDDPFSGTMAGAPWADHEWLGELVMAIAYRLGGWSGILVLFAAALAATLGLLARDLSRWLDPLAASLGLLIGAGCLLPELLARPHILALPFLETWTTSLLVARDRGRVPWPSLPVMLVWANLHGSFLVGLAMIVPVAAEAILLGGSTGWRRAIGPWTLFLGASIAMAMVNPTGWRGVIFPLDLAGMKSLDNIAEWRAPDFSRLQPVEIAMMVALYVGFSRGVTIPAPRLLLLMGLLHLSLRHVRHAMLLGIAGPLIFAASLGRGRGTAPVAAGIGTRALVASAAAIVVLTGARLALPVVLRDGPTLPIAALAHVPPERAAMPVLNDYDFGGYLIFRGIRPFIDGRSDVYGDAFLAEYAEIMRPDSSRLENALDAREIRWTIFHANAPVVAVMDALPGWHRLYADAFAVVHARETPR